jgi:hypothetical protein
MKSDVRQHYLPVKRKIITLSQYILGMHRISRVHILRSLTGLPVKSIDLLRNVPDSKSRIYSLVVTTDETIY